MRPEFAGLPQFRLFSSCFVLLDYLVVVVILLKAIGVMQDERLSYIGSPARELGTQEHTWIGRTTSKLRSAKSGFGALNALHNTDDVVLQVGDACLNFIGKGMILTCFNNYM